MSMITMMMMERGGGDDAVGYGTWCGCDELPTPGARPPVAASSPHGRNSITGGSGRARLTHELT